MTKFYDVYYINNFRKTFTDRDSALAYIERLVVGGGGRYAFEDFEILDGSDSL
jgi:hypothetical protein